jgi:para-nitrobenzyl esterase
VDGDFLPTSPVTEDGFAAAAEKYGLLIGSNLNEWSQFFTEFQYTKMTDVQKALYVKAYPDESPDTAPLVDTLIRLPMLKIMSHKADQNGAPVYAYLFTWQEGNRGSFHGAELPYVFGNGGSNKELSALMMQLWTSYARTGIPSARGLAAWEPYTRQGGATMILDEKSYLSHKHDAALIHSLESGYTY